MAGHVVGDIAARRSAGRLASTNSERFVSPGSLTIDFASSGFSRNRPLALWTLVLSLVVAAMLADFGIGLHKRSLAAADKIALSHPEPKRVSSTPDARLDRQIRQAGAALDRLSMRWEDLFTTVENADSKDLDVLALAPDPDSGNIRISGETMRFDDVLSFVTRLGDQRDLSQVQLASYQTVQRDGADVIEFMVSARWK